MNEISITPPINNETLTHSITLGILVLVLSVTGTAANTLSFSYFSRKNRSNLCRNVTMFLNSVDFMVCTWSLLGVFVFIFETPDKTSQGNTTSFDKAMMGMRNTDIFVTATGYATCLLSVTRTISLLNPFSKINGKFIVATNCIFLLYLILTKLVIAYVAHADSPLLDVSHYLAAVEMSVTIATVTICCLLCSYKLISSNSALGLRSNLSPANRHGTVTIIIISVLFCVVHLCYLLTNVIWYHILGVYRSNEHFSQVLLLLKELSSFVGIPFNSAVNPIIYITRKSDMRRYVRTTWVFKCCSSGYMNCCGKDAVESSANQDTPARPIPSVV